MNHATYYTKLCPLKSCPRCKCKEPQDEPRKSFNRTPPLLGSRRLVYSSGLSRVLRKPSSHFTPFKAISGTTAFGTTALIPNHLQPLPYGSTRKPLEGRLPLDPKARTPPRGSAAPPRPAPDALSALAQDLCGSLRCATCWPWPYVEQYLDVFLITIILHVYMTSMLICSNSRHRQTHVHTPHIYIHRHITKPKTCTWLWK